MPAKPRRHRRPLQRLHLHQPRPTSTVDAHAAWLAGVKASALLAEFYPLPYRQALAGRTITPGTLAQAAVAFLGFVNADVPLMLTCELPDRALTCPDDELHATITDPHDPDWLTILDQLHDDLQTLRPEGCGVGLELFFDEGFHDADLLTCAIWKLLDCTAWSVGVDMDYFFDGACFDDEEADVLRGLRPLPHRTPLSETCLDLTLPGWTYRTAPGVLVRYAVERTGNPLADTLNAEVMEYPRAFAWSDLPRLIAAVPEARQIARDYRAWCEQVVRAPRRSLTQLARALHTTARQVEAAAERDGNTLLKLLGTSHDDTRPASASALAALA